MRRAGIGGRATDGGRGGAIEGFEAVGVTETHLHGGLVTQVVGAGALVVAPRHIFLGREVWMTEWITVKQLIARTQLSRGKAYELARSELRVAEISPRCLRVDADSLEDWLQSRVRGEGGGDRYGR